MAGWDTLLHVDRPGGRPNSAFMCPGDAWLLSRLEVFRPALCRHKRAAPAPGFYDRLANVGPWVAASQCLSDMCGLGSGRTRCGCAESLLLRGTLGTPSLCLPLNAATCIVVLMHMSLFPTALVGPCVACWGGMLMTWMC